MAPRARTSGQIRPSPRLARVLKQGRGGGECMSNELPYHPLADIFPRMEGPEFDQLVGDIKANGLRELITDYQNKILDGRNRYRACLAVGIDPHTRLTPFTGDDKAARAFVTSKNLHR